MRYSLQTEKATLATMNHTDVETDISSQQLPVAWERWLLKEDYLSLLPNLPQPSTPTANERKAWQANNYFTRYINDQASELLHKMTEETFLQCTGRSLNSSPVKIKVFLGATQLMSCLGYPRVRPYWSQKTSVPATADNHKRPLILVMIQPEDCKRSCSYRRRKKGRPTTQGPPTP